MIQVYQYQGPDLWHEHAIVEEDDPEVANGQILFEGDPLLQKPITRSRVKELVRLSQTPAATDILGLVQSAERCGLNIRWCRQAATCGSPTIAKRNFVTVCRWAQLQLHALRSIAIAIGWTGPAFSFNTHSATQLDEAVVWLNGLIEWAESKAKPSVVPSANPILTPVTECPAEFREGRRPDGAPLTPEYCAREFKWNVGKSAWFTKNFGEGKKLTKRFPIGNTFAYSFDELSAISRWRDEETGRRE